jgi:hypothetical protein
LPGTHHGTTALERVRYFPRQLLTADDLRLEQEYFREKQRRHNRFLHGWGVVCGLEVRADATSGPLVVRVCPGYALGPQGDEIYLASPATLDLYGCLRAPADPCLPSAAMAPVASPPTTLAIQIRYAEHPSRPVRTLPAGCGCDDSACEYSRLRDGFEVRCVTYTPPKAPSQAPPTLCEIHDGTAEPPACLPAPDHCWLDLAIITVKKPAAGGSGTMALDDSMIDNRVRRIVFSTAMVQAQVIECCC